MVEKQSKFTKMIADLIEKSYQLGYQMTFAEAYRPEDVANLYAKQGRGIANSLHSKRLAVDFNVFKDGTYLDGSQQWHIPLLTVLGEYFEKIGGSWGGRFSKKDYNHFSLEDKGVK